MRWVEAGFNFIDTADVYSRWVPGHTGGESETVIGRWLAKGGGRRDKVVIATKVGMDKGLSPQWITQAVEDSLRRLQVDCIDLYQAHKDDEATPLVDTLECFARLCQAGQGTARSAPPTTCRAAWRKRCAPANGWACPRYESLQPNYNLYDRAEFERELQPLCLREHVGVHQLLRARRRLPHGQVPVSRGCGKSARGGGVVKKYVNERGLRILAHWMMRRARCRQSRGRWRSPGCSRSRGSLRRSPVRPRWSKLQELVAAARAEAGRRHAAQAGRSQRRR
jgi:aryl-alcohol dehydrogenase-like predicted oxidoreductase